MWLFMVVSQANPVDFIGARLAVLGMTDGVRRLVTSKALDLRGRVIRSRLPRQKRMVFVTTSRSRLVTLDVGPALMLIVLSCTFQTVVLLNASTGSGVVVSAMTCLAVVLAVVLAAALAAALEVVLVVVDSVVDMVVDMVVDSGVALVVGWVGHLEASEVRDRTYVSSLARLIM